ncbi:MAG: hypothetical protein V3U80_08395 [Flavobacteriaceae bacterium]
MKQLITLAILLLAIGACKKETSQNLNNVQELIKGVKHMEKKTEKLAKLKPITKDEIKTWMPEKIGDLKRTAYNIGSQMGSSTVSLDFKGDENKRIKIKILDGAGIGSPIIAMYSMMTKMDIDKENESGYERTETFNKQRVFIKYRSSNSYKKSEISYLFNERFGIEANGWNMEPKELWSYIKKLNLKKLD